jgi:crossover junction endodeoxyribonuclease RuvC
MTVFIGVDPGLTGAVAFIDSRGKAKVFDLPHHPTQHRLDGFRLASLMRSMAPADDEVHVYVEKLHARAGGGGMVQMGSMMQSVGIIQGAIDCTRFPVTEITPQTWKRLYRLTSDKAKSLELARRLYPELQPDLKLAKHDGRAEALLLAHYGVAVATGSYESQDEECEVPF